jgi:hypothetical protein
VYVKARILSERFLRKKKKKKKKKKIPGDEPK